MNCLRGSLREVLWSRLDPEFREMRQKLIANSCLETIANLVQRIFRFHSFRDYRIPIHVFHNGEERLRWGIRMISQILFSRKEKKSGPIVVNAGCCK